MLAPKYVTRCVVPVRYYSVTYFYDLKETGTTCENVYTSESSARRTARKLLQAGKAVDVTIRVEEVYERTNKAEISINRPVYSYRLKDDGTILRENLRPRRISDKRGVTKTTTEYERMKRQVRDYAIQWQSEQADKSASYYELMIFQDYFARLARRYGLVREFRENGII